MVQIGIWDSIQSGKGWEAQPLAGGRYARGGERKTVLRTAALSYDMDLRLAS